MTRPKPPEGATERITIVLPAEVVAHVKRIAGRTATPPSVLVRQWIATPRTTKDNTTITQKEG
jgi:hypothetical protein